MSAFKKLNLQDVFITAYTSKKKWSASGSALFNLGIEKYEILSGSIPYYLGSDKYEEYLRYEQVKHLYYSNYSSSTISGSFENYIQSSLESGSRELLTAGSVISIPSNIIGQRIEPGSFVIKYISGSVSSSIADDGEGKLIISQSNLTAIGTSVGDVVYTHGIAIVSTVSEANNINGTENYTASWQSNYPVLTQNVICKVSDFELNFTQNPSSTLSGSFGKYKDTVTGSDFKPYITAVGLYNDASELIAVAKLGQPLPKPSYIETAFIIKLDL